jgi:hypothetical protein
MWLDKKYINLLSSRLEKFRWKGNIANCRCPLCGDSQKHPNKTRGYFYESKGTWWFHCHNCSEHMMVKTLLKRMDSVLYNEYVSETIKEKYGTKKETNFTTETEKRLAVPEDVVALRKLRTIASLPETSEPQKFMGQRRLPGGLKSIFRWAPAFKSFTNTIIPRKFDEQSLKRDEGRIVIPFFDKEGRFHAFQGRSLGADDAVRYISIKIDETIPLIWGLDKVDLSRTVYATEGVLDAVFLPNSLAICGGSYFDLSSITTPARTTLVYDNEPRSTETKKKIAKAIDEGYQVCIWPEYVKSKDINEMILKENLTRTAVHVIIDKCTYSGMKAKVALSQWSKK